MGAAFGEIVEKLRRSTVQVNRGGSGVIWSPDGSIVTNAHVVEGSNAVEVGLWDGRRFPANIAKRDRRRDLASIQLRAEGLPSATPGDSNALRVGEFVVAVGNPLGFIGAASTGVVHQVENRRWVVSQLRLAPGNSGGPLANARGEVVGINTMIAGGLAFAVPSGSVTQFLSSQINADGGLGVVVRPVQFGLITLEVIPDSPADRASLLQGDILIGAKGRLFHSVQDLGIAINASRGGILELQFRRGLEREHPHGGGNYDPSFSESCVIRVLVSPPSSELEQTVRSIPSLAFAGATDPHHLTELSGDVLLIQVVDAAEYDWAALADLPIPVLLILDSVDSALIGSALRSGIRGAISGDATPQEIEAAVQAVNAGLVVTMPDAQPFTEDLAEPLSTRELEVLDRLAEGLSNKLIAHALNISEHTVKTHVASIFTKLGASSRTEAVSQAIRRGLVML